MARINGPPKPPNGTAHILQRGAPGTRWKMRRLRRYPGSVPSNTPRQTDSFGFSPAGSGFNDHALRAWWDLRLGAAADTDGVTRTGAARQCLRQRPCPAAYLSSRGRAPVAMLQAAGLAAQRAERPACWAGVLSPLRAEFALVTSILAPLSLLWLVRLPRWPTAQKPREAVPIGRSSVLLVTSLLVSVIFVLGLGPAWARLRAMRSSVTLAAGKWQRPLRNLRWGKDEGGRAGSRGSREAARPSPSSPWQVTDRLAVGIGAQLVQLVGEVVQSLLWVVAFALDALGLRTSRPCHPGSTAPPHHATKLPARRLVGFGTGPGLG